ncbi:hypothetical protein [uncultured Treponema sp.]|nr:hypothetical protein [uncultured Treponema sp.]
MLYDKDLKHIVSLPHEGVNLPDEAFKFHLEKSTRFDDDILLEYGKGA